MTSELRALMVAGGEGTADYGMLNDAFARLAGQGKAAVIEVARGLGLVGYFATKARALEAISQRVYGPIDARTRCDF
jgi:hypothetical protein